MTVKKTESVLEAVDLLLGQLSASINSKGRGRPLPTAASSSERNNNAKVRKRAPKLPVHTERCNKFLQVKPIDAVPRKPPTTRKEEVESKEPENKEEGEKDEQSGEDAVKANLKEKTLSEHEDRKKRKERYSKKDTQAQTPQPKQVRTVVNTESEASNKTSDTATADKECDLSKFEVVDSGMMFLCTNQTEGECLEKMLFGSPKRHIDDVESVTENTALFLYRIDRNNPVMHGVFVPDGKPGMNIDPDAWNGRFPAQVRVKNFYKFPCPLPGHRLRKIFKHRRNDKQGQLLGSYIAPNRLLTRSETHAVIAEFYNCCNKRGGRSSEDRGRPFDYVRHKTFLYDGQNYGFDSSSQYPYLSNVSSMDNYFGAETRRWTSQAGAVTIANAAIPVFVGQDRLPYLTSTLPSHRIESGGYGGKWLVKDPGKGYLDHTVIYDHSTLPTNALSDPWIDADRDPLTSPEPRSVPTLTPPYKHEDPPINPNPQRMKRWFLTQVANDPRQRQIENQDKDGWEEGHREVVKPMAYDHERCSGALGHRGFRPVSSPPSTTPQHHAQISPRHRVQNSASSRAGSGRGGFGQARINHRGQKQDYNDRRQASSDYRQVSCDSRKASSEPRKTSSEHRKASSNQRQASSNKRQPSVWATPDPPRTVGRSNPNENGWDSSPRISSIRTKRRPEPVVVRNPRYTESRTPPTSSSSSSEPEERPSRNNMWASSTPSASEQRTSEADDTEAIDKGSFNEMEEDGYSQHSQELEFESKLCSYVIAHSSRPVVRRTNMNTNSRSSNVSE